VVFVYQFGVPFALSLSKGEREGTFGVRVKTIWSSAGPKLPSSFYSDPKRYQRALERSGEVLRQAQDEWVFADQFGVPFALSLSKGERAGTNLRRCED